MFGGSGQGHAHLPAAMLEEAGRQAGEAAMLGRSALRRRWQGGSPLLPGRLAGLGRRPSPHASPFLELIASATPRGGTTGARGASLPTGSGLPSLPTMALPCYCLSPKAWPPFEAGDEAQQGEETGSVSTPEGQQVPVSPWR